MTDQRQSLSAPHTGEQTPVEPRPQPQTGAAVVPDTLAGSVLDLTWQPGDYAPIIYGSGALKLSSSAVAPLVAIAHGYKTIVEEDLKDLFKAKAVAPTGTHARQIRGAVGGQGDDALLMPWYSASTIGNAADQRRMFPHLPEPDMAEVSLQLRPARPRVNEKTGKPVKYELLAGQQTPLGFHPSTPLSWLREPTTMFITEGALKADSALSAYLLSVGVAKADLAQTCDGDVAAARTKLREIMEALPADKRILVMALVGVGTWHQHPDWSNLRLRDIDVWVAFDADVASNPDVWRQANALWKKIDYERGRAHLLQLPDDGDAKSGVDDYLATHGDWKSLTSHLSTSLPKAPARKEIAKKGEMRIDPDRLVTVKNEPGTNDFGQSVDQWVDEYRFAGRVRRIKDLRSAEPEEMRTGKAHTDVDPTLVDSEVEIELSWHDPDGVGVRTVNVLGTAATLADPPEQWHRRGAIVPSAVTAHPDWPPKAEWLKAMKSHRAEEIERTTAWEQMGWVPTPTGVPVFIAGRDVLGPDGLVSNPAIASPGIDENRLAGATMFGLTPAENEDEAREAIETVVRHYLAAWTNPAHAAVVLAAAIRPVAPQPPRIAVLFTGSAGGGKALALDQVVPVPVSDKFPTGWAQHGQLAVGDQVFSPEGEAIGVTGISPIWHEDTYEVEFDDGQVITASGQHLFHVMNKGGRNIVDRLTKSGGSPWATKAANLRSAAAQLAPGAPGSIGDIADAIGQPYETTAGMLKSLQIPSVPGVIDYNATLPITLYDTNHPALAQAGVAPQGALSIEMIRRSNPGIDIAEVVQVIEENKVPGSVTTIERKVSRAGHLYNMTEAILRYAESLEEIAGGQNRSANRSVAQMFEDFATASYSVPVAAAVEGPEVDLPLDPYCLGAWLGDGTRGSSGFTTKDQEILTHFETAGFSPSKNIKNPYGYTINGLLASLRLAGVAERKHIPAAYLRASMEQRTALLQGLMDTDGSIDADRGRCELALSDKALAEDALSLIRSLGIKARMASGSTSYVNTDGARIECKNRYRIHFTTTKEVFRLERKRSRLRSSVSPRTGRLFIKDIRKVETVPTVCITVDHPCGMYLAGQGVPTHNTYSISCGMHFWQAKPGVFKGRTMGAVSDTFAATEYAISRVPIWGIDDLAPSPDGRKADSDEAKVTDLIRAIHNDAPKRRMNADMTSRGVNSSRVMAMFSAENPLSSISAMQRVIHVRVTNGFLSPDYSTTEALDEMVSGGYTVNHVTAACIQYIQRKASIFGWEAVTREYEEIYSGMSDEARRVMDGAGDAKRAARNAADLGLGLRILLETAQHLGVDEEIEDTLEGLIGKMYEVAAEGYRAKKSENAGINAVRAVALALASGSAHVTSASGDGALPIDARTKMGEHGSGYLNEQLGWSMPTRPEDAARPKGTRIGTLIYKGDDPVVLLSPEVAFSVAQRAFPRLLQHGQKSTTAWETAWSEKLMADYWARKQSGGGTETIVVRAKGITGVPVRLATLLDVAGGGRGEVGEVEPQDEQD